MAQTSIIIRCYNEEAHIGRLLSGIMQQLTDDFEIIIVDSGSTDATTSIASQYPVRILHIDKEDFSFGRSLNLGCEAASGQFLVFASAHTYPVYNDWIKQLLQPFENDRLACVYGKQRGNELTRFSEHRVFARWFPETSDLNQDHPFCNNANAAIRRSIWERFRYDETLTGLEDLAWAKQVLSAGYCLGYKADAEIIHVHEETLRQVLNRYRREAIAMKAIFPHEKFSFLSFLHMWMKNAVSDARLASKNQIFWTNFLSILAFRLAQFWGTYQGYAQMGTINATLRRKFYYPNELAAPDQDQDHPQQHSKTNREMIDYSLQGEKNDPE